MHVNYQIEPKKQKFSPKSRTEETKLLQNIQKNM
jgi:hypothetical protein